MEKLLLEFEFSSSAISFIFSLPQSLHHIFADDVKLHYSCGERNADNALSKINEDIAAVYAWAWQNGLIMNAKKTKTIAFTNSTLRTILSDIDGKTVRYSEQILNLAVIMDMNLNFNSHVKDISAKVFSILRSLWPNYYIQSWQPLVSLVKSLIIFRLSINFYFFLI